MLHFVRLLSLGVAASFLWVPVPNAKAVYGDLVEWAEGMASGSTIGRMFIDDLEDEIKVRTDRHGRVTPELQDTLTEIERRFSSSFDEGARRAFQTMLAKIGAKKLGPIEMPEEDTPFWLKDSEEFRYFRSTREIPHRADIVVIGAGLTGVSAAYHLSKASGKSVVLLEADRPAAQSSGRNGGNFQLLAESYIDDYGGLVEERYKALKMKYPDAPEADLRVEADRRARVLFEFSFNNLKRFTQIVRDEKIDCDFRNAGWLRVATSQQEEDAILRDVAWMGDVGIGIEVWPAEKIQKQVGIPAQFSGRYVAESGNYHPYKFVVELLRRVLARGVKFYSDVEVSRMGVGPGGKVILQTINGHRIVADQVIVATNAFTPKLLPQLKMIETVPSQIFNMEHLKDGLRGMTVTKEGGDIYYNFPGSKQYRDARGQRRGMVHFGLDFKHSVEDPARLQRSPGLFAEMLRLTHEEFPDSRGQPPSRMWVGPMAFTEDHVPLIGFMHSATAAEQELKNIVIAAGFQGYGGSFCIHAGYVAAEMALTGQTHPDVPKEMFSPGRFFEGDASGGSGAGPSAGTPASGIRSRL